MTDTDLAAAAAAFVLASGGVALWLIAMTRRVGDRAIAWLGALVAVGATATAIANGARPPAFGSALALDAATTFFTTLVALATAVSLVLALAGARPARPRGDEVALVLFAAAGAAIAVAAADLLVLLAALALLALPSSVLGARKDIPRALSRYLSGATTLAVTAYGIALLYAATGETAYAALGRATHNPLYLAGIGLVLAGLVARAVLASGHWSTIATLASAAALLRFAGATRSGDAALDWEVSLAALAAVALAVAAIAALTETDLARLLRYATVAQLGYVLVAAAGFAAPAAAFSLALFAALSLGAIGIVALLPGRDPSLADLAGLVRRRPLVALAIGAHVLGLAGLPPTAGFLAKAFVFEAAVRAQLLWLVIVGALATAVIAVALARVVLACFAPPRLDAVAPARARVATAVLLGLGVAVLVAGFGPGPLLDAAQAVRF